VCRYRYFHPTGDALNLCILLICFATFAFFVNEKGFQDYVNNLLRDHQELIPLVACLQ
jgi:hypothetical protein